jgi:DHA1 family multidrug resistance protein-like MFS transporter
MFGLLHRTYFVIFRRYPVLGRMAAVAVLGELLFAAVNNYALPFYVLEDLRQPGRTLGLLVSTFLVVEMLLKLPFGHLSDRYGRRVFMSAGLALCVVTPVVICAVPAEVFILTPALIYVVVMPLRALDGAGAAALWPPLFAAVPDNVPPAERGVAMSVLNTSYLAGLALGPALAGAAMKLWVAQGASAEWVGKAPFVLAAAAAVGGALVARTLPESRAGARREQESAEGGLPAPGWLVVVMVIMFGEMFAVAMLGPYLAPYVREVTGFARSDVGFLLLLLFLPAGLLGIPVGHLTDRLPKRRVAQAALWVSALGLWCVPRCQSLWPMMGAGVVVMLGFLFGLPAWLALIADQAPEAGRGRMMGLMATAQGLGAFLGPVVGGYLWDVDIRNPFYASAGLLTLCALTALLFIRAEGAGKQGSAGESHLGRG